MRDRGALLAFCIIGISSAVIMLFLVFSLTLQCLAHGCFDLTQSLFPELEAEQYEYWMDWGTLLGARREGTGIAHDYDADIGMRESEFQRMRHNWKHSRMGKKYKLTKAPDGLYRIQKGAAWVDVFRYDEQPDGSLVMRSMAHTKHSCRCKNKGHATHARDIFPLKKMRFGGVTASAPHQTEDYLAHLYGDSWTVPLKNGLSRMIFWD